MLHCKKGPTTLAPTQSSRTWSAEGRHRKGDDMGKRMTAGAWDDLPTYVFFLILFYFTNSYLQNLSHLSMTGWQQGVKTVWRISNPDDLVSLLFHLFYFTDIFEHIDSFGPPTAILAPNDDNRARDRDARALVSNFFPAFFYFLFCRTLPIPHVAESIHVLLLINL